MSKPAAGKGNVHHAYGTCARKSYFTSYAVAMEFCRRIRRQGGPRLAPYRCQYCNGWHLTKEDHTLKPKGNKENRHEDNR